MVDGRPGQCHRKQVAGASPAEPLRLPSTRCTLTSMQRPLRVLVTSTGNRARQCSRAGRSGARRSGHQVRWAVAPDGGAAVERMGFEWSPAGLTAVDRRERPLMSWVRSWRLPMAERRGPMFARVLRSRGGPGDARDLAPIIDRVQPDLMVREMSELGAAPMAAARGIPLVTVAFSGVLPERARRLVLDDLRPLWMAKASAARRGRTSTGSSTSTRFLNRSANDPIRRSFARSVATRASRAWSGPLGRGARNRAPFRVRQLRDRGVLGVFPWHELFRRSLDGR